MSLSKPKGVTRLTRRAVFDPEGNFMAWVGEDYLASALARGEVVEDDDGVLRVVPQPVRELSPEEKRRLVLAKERAKK